MEPPATFPYLKAMKWLREELFVQTRLALVDRRRDSIPSRWPDLTKAPMRALMPANIGGMQAIPINCVIR